MRVYVLSRPTGPAGLVRVERPIPEPARGQVLVRMKAASLNYRDLLVAEGRYGRGELPPDLVPLSDGAGEVVAVGEAVTRVAVGDRVAGLFMQGWLAGALAPEYARTALGGVLDGVLADYVLFDQQGLVRLPDHLSYAQGATLPCAAVTAWHALFASARPLTAGQQVLLLGTGGVSMFALQFACAAGAQVILTSSSDAKLARAQALGAHATINYRTHPEWQDEVLRLTGGLGVDHVVEVGGAGTLQRSVRATRPGGAVHLIGVLSAGDFNPIAVMQRGLVLDGIFVGSREMFEAMNRLLAAQRLEPLVDRIFAFDEAAAAYRYLATQQHLGKVVISLED